MLDGFGDSISDKTTFFGSSVSAHLGPDDCAAARACFGSQIFIVFSFKIFRVLGYIPPLVAGLTPDFDTIVGRRRLLGHIVLYSFTNLVIEHFLVLFNIRSVSHFLTHEKIKMLI